MGQEYIRSHRSCQQLAVRLSHVGFHVLRFDFYGCGDSSGDFDQADLREWLDDISLAIGEIQRRCGSVKICLVGLRLGGTLSMMVGAARNDIDCLVLWDPVVNGNAYVDELRGLHGKMLRYAYIKPKQAREGHNYTEILGFPFTNLMLADLAKIDLLSIREKPANHVVLIEGNSERDENRLRDHLTKINNRFVYRHVPSPKIWLEEPHKVLVPHKLLESVIVAISEICQ